MSSVVESALVIARRDFTATVFTRTFILFLLAPVLLFAFSMFVGQAAARSDAESAQPVVAVVADSVATRGWTEARARLAQGTSQRALPRLRAVDPAENVTAQAQALLADREASYSAVLSGTLERPVLTGPARLDRAMGEEIRLVVEEARRTAALQEAGIQLAPVHIARVTTVEAAGDLKLVRNALARGAQFLIFFVTLFLATMLLSNLVEEKTNKVIEVLAAAVPLDAVFLGKLLAMLGISVVGLSVWGGLLGLAIAFVEALPLPTTLPQVAPAVGWPAFLALLILYYSTNYLLLGALFLGIGGQANTVREVQTLSMPVTMLQLLVLLLASMAIGRADSWLGWAAFIFPLSSPLAMAAYAAQSELLWPHLLALAWQALWVLLILRMSVRMFRRNVFKSGSRASFLEELRFWRA